MSSMVVRSYRSADATNLRGGYQKPSIVTTQIPNHKDGHYVRPNKVALKHLADPNVHFKMFNSIIKPNVKTFGKYIINVFSYMLKDTTSDWCHNYMSKYHDYIFSELIEAFCKCHQKIQNDGQIYMELKNMQEET